MEKKIIEALLKAGAKQPHSHVPNQLEFQGYPIKIHKGETLESVFIKLIKAGKTLKTWEFKSVMEVQ